MSVVVALVVGSFVRLCEPDIHMYAHACMHACMHIDKRSVLSVPKARYDI
jgi:hypothetical protein